MDRARAAAEAGEEFVITATSQTTDREDLGVHVFFNHPEPFCYTYMIPGEWISGSVPKSYTTMDGKGFAGVLFWSQDDLESVEGSSLLNRAQNSITQSYENLLKEELKDVSLEPFESAHPDAWRYSTAPIKKGDATLGLGVKILIDLNPETVVAVSVSGTEDDAALARKIIKSLETGTHPGCYLPRLEQLLARVDVDARSRYANPEYGWSVDLPEGWTVSVDNPSSVRFFSGSRDALCGVQGAEVSVESLHELTDYLLEHSRKSLEKQGKESKLISREEIQVADGVVGNDVIVEIATAGKSRRVYLLVEGTAYVIDCETYTEKWEQFEPAFGEIIGSFALGR